ncbi:Ger(x)C family spore germination protein [Paenibacillus spongiae]|uniref:Ger(X)C family spore germination protein n=1 Tax=Paenibacillus spongiae TaxID=2909671 RepID=A0ABY5SFT2_9BACL|nr:Ger(x)C family spore germination protein [Paenibacillus spongiae]UVI32629.1 Ger(x)C family spore germination protein [Paenibacillus spongiae]
MMKTITAVILFACCLLLSGCWDKMELDEYAFVQAVAIDETEEGKIDLTIHTYKPSGGGGGGTPGGAQGMKNYINIHVTNESVFEAIRDFTLHMGRKAQWSHMRVLLIGEELAKKRNIGEILDFFSRDHEPRATIDILIGKDKAGNYLEVDPYIEKTEAQELREITRLAHRYSAKAVETNLMDLSLQMKSETGIARLPYITRDKRNNPNSVPVAGTALIKKGRMAGLLKKEDTESLIVLTGKYDNGVIETDCPDPKKYETLEADSLKTKITPKIKGDSVDVHVSVKIDGIVGELVCHSLKDKAGYKRYVDHVEQSVERKLRKTIKLLQKKKLDAIGIGDLVYTKNPELWKRWKPDWEERFARIPFKVDVKVNVTSTGMDIGKPYVE